MRRWNGWGDDTIEFALDADALGFLARASAAARRLRTPPSSRPAPLAATAWRRTG